MFLCEISSRPENFIQPYSDYTHEPKMQEPKLSSISELQITQSEAEEQKLFAQGFLSVPGDMNKGTGGNKTYLWYRRSSETGITRVQFSFTKEMADGLTSAGYTKINKNLNAGAGGDDIYLWYYKPSSPSPSLFDDRILALHVTTQADDESEMFRLRWERLACDLNRKAGGTRVHLWVRRKPPTFISDIKATANFSGDVALLKAGWTRVGENINRDASGAKVFIWYLLSATIQGNITDLEISTNAGEIQYYKNGGYQQLPQALNQGAAGNPVYLWYKKDSGIDPIKNVTVITSESSLDAYKSAGNQVIVKNLNTGNPNSPVYLCYYQ